MVFLLVPGTSGWGPWSVGCSDVRWFLGSGAVVSLPCGSLVVWALGSSGRHSVAIDPVEWDLSRPYDGVCFPVLGSMLPLFGCSLRHVWVYVGLSGVSGMGMVLDWEHCQLVQHCTGHDSLDSRLSCQSHHLEFGFALGSFYEWC